MNNFFFKLALILLINISILASDKSVDIKDSDKVDFTNISLVDAYKYYSQYLNLYISANQKNDTKIEIKALESIIIYGKKLGENVHKYEKLLKNLSPNSEVLKNFKNGINILNRLEVFKNRLELRFNYNIKNDTVSYFKLYDKHTNLYRYVFDINSDFGTSKRVYSSKNRLISKIKIAQYKSGISRLVIYSHRVINFTSKVFKNGYILYFKREEVNRNSILNYNFNDHSITFNFRYKLQNSDVNINKFINQKSLLNIYSLYVKSSVNKNITLKHPYLKSILINRLNSDYFNINLESVNKIHVSYLIKDKKLIINFKKIKIKKSHVKNSHKKHSKFVIVIDPGHGGKDPGTMHNNIKEKDIVLRIGLKLRNRLLAKGYKVYMTRSSDIFIELKNRTAFANDKDADLFVSIHVNSIKANNRNKFRINGFETFFLSPARSVRAKNIASYENSVSVNNLDKFSKNIFLSLINKEKINASRKLAIDIQKSIFKSAVNINRNIKSLGVKEGPFWVLVAAQMPSVLVETGFLSNTKERKRLINNRYQNSIANGIANGVDAYFRKNIALR